MAVLLNVTIPCVGIKCSDKCACVDSEVLGVFFPSSLLVLFAAEIAFGQFVLKSPLKAQTLSLLLNSLRWSELHLLQHADLLLSRPLEVCVYFYSLQKQHSSCI